MVKKQLLFALRRLGRHKLNTTINIFGLTLGVLACLVIYLYVSFEFSYEKGRPDTGRIYRVVRIFTNAAGDAGPGSGMIPPLASTLQRETTGYGTVTGFYSDDSRVIVPNPGKPNRYFADLAPGQRKHMAFAEPGFFDLFPSQWLAGNPATALKEPFSVVLTESEAQKYFGGANPQDWMGRTLIYHDSLTVSVTGIIKDHKGNTDFNFTDLIAYSTLERSFLKDGFNQWGFWDSDAQAYVKLAPGVTPAQAIKQFPAFIARHVKVLDGSKVRLELQPLTDIHFNGTYTDEYGRRANKPTLYGLAGIALFILVIASINFINLSTAQAVQRSREVGVRKVLGGSRSGLITQFLIETGVIVGASMGLALLLANPVLSALHGFIPEGVRLNGADGMTWIFAAITVIITCLLAGWYPARTLSSFLPVTTLRGQGVQQLNGKSWLRKGLIVFQFTVSLLFIIGTMVVGRQIHYVLDSDLGFKKDAILTVELPGDQPKEKRRVLATEMARIPGVQQISLAGGSPQSKDHGGTYLEYKGKGATDIKIDVDINIIDTNFIPLYGLTLLAGRNFHAGDTSHGFEGTRYYIVNETAAKALGFQHPADAVGKLVSSGFNGQIGPILGVIKDWHAKSLHETIRPFFFTTNPGRGNIVAIKLASANRSAADVKGLLAKVEIAFKQVFPHSNFTTRFFDDAIADLYERDRKTSQIMNLSMAVAIFISCMGLFGLAAFTASQRTREIGIRKVLGAGVPGLVTMLSKEFVLLVGLATLIAAPIAGWAMHQWLQDFAYRTTVPWWIYAIAGLGAVIIALLTVSFQAIRAARANPVESLRSE